MSGGWPSTIDPVQLADQGAHLHGELPLKGMPRLAAMCWSSEGSITIDLTFERNQGNGVRTMRGVIDASVRVVCQRCLTPFDVALHSQPELLLLQPGERTGLSDNDDVLIVEQPIALSSIVEDELLLEMPMIPMHASADCPATRADEVPAKTEKEKHHRPFSVLEQLKRTDR